MCLTPIIRRVAWQRELTHYPAATARAWYLIVTLAIAVTLYSHIVVAVSVLPLLQRELGFSLQQWDVAIAIRHFERPEPPDRPDRFLRPARARAGPAWPGDRDGRRCSPA